MAKHSVQRKRKKRGNGFSFGSALVLVLCFIGVSFGLYLWQGALVSAAGVVLMVVWLIVKKRKEHNI